jgi:hypothetical protein
MAQASSHSAMLPQPNLELLFSMLPFDEPAYIAGSNEDSGFGVFITLLSDDVLLEAGIPRQQMQLPHEKMVIAVIDYQNEDHSRLGAYGDACREANLPFKLITDSYGSIPPLVAFGNAERFADALLARGLITPAERGGITEEISFAIKYALPCRSEPVSENALGGAHA